MRLKETFAFAFGYQAKQAWPWICFVALAAITWQLGGQMQGHAALEHGYWFNSPYVVANVTQVMAMLWLPMAAALTGSIVARDFQSRAFALACATPVGRFDYLAGHFLAAFALNAILALALPLGLLLCLPLPWLQPVMGPFRIEAYLAPYLLLSLPNAFVVTAMSFALVAWRRKASAAYPAVGLVLFLGLFGSQYIARTLGYWDTATLFDPMALTIVSKSSTAWTDAEKSVRILGLDGVTFANRAIWIGVALALLALTFRRFRLAQPDGGARRGRRRAPLAIDAPAAVPVMPRRIDVAFGPATRLRQLAALSADAFRQAATGWPGIVLLLLVAVFGLATPELMESVGMPIWPTTGTMVELMAHSEAFFVLVLPLVLMLAAGELAWRDRDAGIAAIADAAPVPDWMRFCGRLGGLALLVLALQLLRIAVAMVVQASLDFTAFDPMLYAQALLGLQAVDWLLLVVLAMTLHAIVDHRHLAQLLVIAAFLGIVGASALGVDDRLFVYGSDTGWTYSDMRGFAWDLVPWAWFKAYWAGWAAMLAVLAILLLPRGSGSGLRARWRELRLRMSRPLLGTAVAGLVLALGAGGVIFHDTHVLHPFVDRVEAKARAARYEKLYGQYADAPKPVLTDLRLRVDLHPETGTATVAGTYRLVNQSTQPIATLHVATSHDVRMRLLQPDRPARHAIADEDLGQHAFMLARPLQPGEAMQLRFEVAFGGDGFTRHGIDPAIAANGSRFLAEDWLPLIGYQASRELNNAADRREFGLAARPEVPLLDDPKIPYTATRGQRVSVDTVISTAPGQTAIAPGLLRKAWTEDGRPHFRYVTEAPIRGGDLGFYSARYAVRRAQWRDVAIEVYHDPAQAWNAERFVRGATATLAAMSRDFGPYPLRHLRFTERPGPGGLHSAPGDISFQEGFARAHPEADWRDIDFAFGVVAHEVAHQWWGGVLTSAPVEGAPLLSESLAWYSALTTMRETFGEAHLQRMLAVLRESYLTPRAQAGKSLLHATDWDEAYRRGPFAMYALDAYLGTERMNAGLRNLVRAHADAKPPLATARDLYRALQAVTPPDRQWLLHDLLAANTFWDLKTTTATVRPMGSGQWEVAMDVQARKVTVDELGAETEVPMHDAVEIGVLGAGKDDQPGPTLYRRMHPIHSGRQRIVVRVPSLPAEAGIDPRHLLLDVRPDNNLLPVCTEGDCALR
ncbi:MAG: M1 family aminopeptidase [Luteimonas sp.]